MSVVVEFHPQAELEAIEAHQYYAARSLNAADRFMAELDRAIDSVAEFPDRHPTHTHGTRILMLKRFPYLVIYKLLENTATVIAVAHGRRRPSYWKSRLKD